MRKAIITYGFAIVLVCFSVVTLVLGSPRMKLKETEFDFGFVPQNSTVSHVFWLKSTGSDSLRILKVVPG